MAKIHQSEIAPQWPPGLVSPRDWEGRETDGRAAANQKGREEGFFPSVPRPFPSASLFPRLRAVPEGFVFRVFSYFFGRAGLDDPPPS